MHSFSPSSKGLIFSLTALSIVWLLRNRHFSCSWGARLWLFLRLSRRLLLPASIKHSELQRNGNSSEILNALEEKMTNRCSFRFKLVGMEMFLCFLNSTVPDLSLKTKLHLSRSLLLVCWTGTMCGYLSPMGNSNLQRAADISAESSPKFNGSEWGTRSAVSGGAQLTMKQ